MRLRMLLAMFLVFAVSPLSGLGQTVQGGKQDESTAPLTKLDGRKGTILGVLNNEELLMESENRYLVVQFGKEYWKLGLSRGDEIQVWGNVIPEKLMGNEFKANRIEMIRRAVNRPKAMMIMSIREMQETGIADRL